MYILPKPSFSHIFEILSKFINLQFINQGALVFIVKRKGRHQWLPIHFMLQQHRTSQIETNGFLNVSAPLVKFGFPTLSMSLSMPLGHRNTMIAAALSGQPPSLCACPCKHLPAVFELLESLKSNTDTESIHTSCLAAKYMNRLHRKVLDTVGESGPCLRRRKHKCAQFITWHLQKELTKSLVWNPGDNTNLNRPKVWLSLKPLQMFVWWYGSSSLCALPEIQNCHSLLDDAVVADEYIQLGSWIFWSCYSWQMQLLF